MHVTKSILHCPQQVRHGAAMEDDGISGQKDESAVNEFTANSALLLGSFPTLFLFGTGVDKDYGMSEADTRHLLTQEDKRFAQCKDFMLLLFNQKMRHTALRAVRSKIRSNPGLLRKFEEAINDPGLQPKLERALANTAGGEAQKLLTQFLPVLRTCHAAVPFSTSERYSVLGKMRALLDFFGMPSEFFTVAPTDVDNKLILTLSAGKNQVEVELPETFQRFAGLAQNPAAAARVYKRQLRAFLDNLLGLPCALLTKKGQPVCGRMLGIFGIPFAYNLNREIQARGSMHFHALF